MFLDGLFGLLRLTPDPNAKNHFGSDREQQQATRDAKRGQADRERAQQPVADQRAAGENRGSDQRGTKRDVAPCAFRQAMRDRQIGRDEADRIDDDDQRDKRRNEKFDRHARRLGYHKLRLPCASGVHSLQRSRPFARKNVAGARLIIPEQTDSSAMSAVTNCKFFEFGWRVPPALFWNLLLAVSY